MMDKKISLKQLKEEAYKLGFCVTSHNGRCKVQFLSHGKEVDCFQNDGLTIGTKREVACWLDGFRSAQLLI